MPFPTKTKASPLLALPAELRQIILQHVFRGSFVSIVRRNKPPTAEAAARPQHIVTTSIAADLSLDITQACRQLRREALHVAATAVELRTKSVSLEMLRAVVPRDVLRLVTTVQFDAACLSYAHQWPPEMIPIMLPSLQTLTIHMKRTWEMLRQLGDVVGLLEAARKPFLVYDRLMTRLKMPLQYSIFSQGAVLDRLQHLRVARSICLAVHIGEGSLVRPPHVTVRLAWPSRNLISCIDDNVWEFTHDPYQARGPATKELPISR